MSNETPLVPTLLQPPTLASATMKAWFFDPQATVVDQCLVATMGTSEAEFLIGRTQDLITERYISKGQRPTVIHDWRTCMSYEVNARNRLVEWGRQYRKTTEAVVVILSNNTSPIVRIATLTGSMLLRQIGVNMTVVFDVDQAVHAFKLKPTVPPVAA